jgi:hypothetical protein
MDAIATGVTAERPLRKAIPSRRAVLQLQPQLAVPAAEVLARAAPGARALLADDELRSAMRNRCARFVRETFVREETIDAYLTLFS